VAYFLASLFLLIFPVAPILLDVKKGKTDIFVMKREKRMKFFLITLLSHLVGFTLFKSFKYELLAPYMLCYFTVTLTLLFITLKWKISIHSAGVAGPVTYLALVLDYRYSVLYLPLILTMWARYKMKAHSIS